MVLILGYIFESLYISILDVIIRPKLLPFKVIFKNAQTYIQFGDTCIHLVVFVLNYVCGRFFQIFTSPFPSHGIMSCKFATFFISFEPGYNFVSCFDLCEADRSDTVSDLKCLCDWDCPTVSPLLKRAFQAILLRVRKAYK